MACVLRNKHRKRCEPYASGCQEVEHVFHYLGVVACSAVCLNVLGVWNSARGRDVCERMHLKKATELRARVG